MNERLRAALTERGIGYGELATLCGVDPKTASRWIGGRRPQPRYRLLIAHRLGVSEDFLWPTATGHDEAAIGLVGTYTNRASVPRTLWPKLIRQANEYIDILVFAGNFLTSTDRHIVDLLGQRAESGTRIRMCLGDPDRLAVAIRGEEEGLGAALAANCRASIDRFRPLTEKRGCEIRLHDTTLYNSLFRFDGILLVNPHIWGQPATMNPVLHLESTTESDWFSNYTASFDAVWTTPGPGIPRTQTSPRSPTVAGMGRGEMVAQAEELARRYLAPLSRRMAHVEGVALQAAHATAVVDDPDLLISAAWLHDIGYAPDIRRIGFHPIDGAVFLREHGFNNRLCGLVANHSAAYAEAGLRGLDIEWPDEQSALRNALWWADITTTPTGEVTTASERILEVQTRYGPGHFVTRAIGEAASALLAAAESTEELLGLVRAP